MLVHDLLTDYAAIESGLDGPLRPARPPVSPSRATWTGGWRQRWWMLRRMIRLQREDRRDRQTPLPDRSGIPPQSQWAHWIWPADQTVALVRRCRQERASLGAVLLGAVCYALSECLPAAQARFKCQFPFDLRQSLEAVAPVTGSDMGCFVSAMNAHYEIAAGGSLWDLSRRAHRDLQEFERRGGPAFYYNLSGTAAARRFAHSASMRSAGNMRPTLLVTSYGVVDLQGSYGSLRPTACTLTFKSDVSGPSLIIEALVLDQRLNVGLVASGLEPEFWDRLATAVRRNLDAAARPQTAGPPATGAALAPASAPQRSSVAPPE